MALLKGVRGALLGFVALCAGCALLQRFGAPAALAFSHALHVGEEQQACVTCHGDFARSDAPGMPAPDTCAACHDEIDAEKPPERHVATLFDGERFKAARAAALDDEVLFSHKLHARDPKSCDACHAGIAGNERIDEDIGVTMEGCTNCHAERDVARECATCHRELREDRAPPSHALDWTRRHGGSVRSCTRATAERCEICHTESDCVTCHKAVAPQNHNAHFRMRGHGLTARMERQDCAACHTPDSCEVCHRETTPLSHGASWGGTLARHCVSCHQPLAANGCSVCHAATPSHALAAPKPDWHTPAMNCRQCHGLSAALPHVDNGDDCNACHM